MQPLLLLKSIKIRQSSVKIIQVQKSIPPRLLAKLTTCSCCLYQRKAAFHHQYVCGVPLKSNRKTTNLACSFNLQPLDQYKCKLQRHSHILLALSMKHIFFLHISCRLLYRYKLVNSISIG